MQGAAGFQPARINMRRERQVLQRVAQAEACGSLFRSLFKHYDVRSPLPVSAVPGNRDPLAGARGFPGRAIAAIQLAIGGQVIPIGRASALVVRAERAWLFDNLRGGEKVAKSVLAKQTHCVVS